MDLLNLSDGMFGELGHTPNMDSRCIYDRAMKGTILALPSGLGLVTGRGWVLSREQSIQNWFVWVGVARYLSMTPRVHHEDVV